MGKKKTGKNHGTIPPVAARSVSDVDVLQQQIFGPGKAGHLHGDFHVSNRYCSCSTKAGTSTKEPISVLDGHPLYNKDAQGSAKAFWEDFGKVNESESESSSSVSRTRGLEDTDCDEESCGTPQSVNATGKNGQTAGDNSVWESRDELDNSFVEVASKKRE
ncbi:Hypothetical predicted protein [Olea europaea subsp. europaea]|uniref:Uncharacterized protein n=1 Tax=Olea europaea subsp. europaea TaxID=158383 RepID=A0A8S0TBK7_OLEEU|nr:Hypothetical predicted protein [Olea europaea subsp. europaea]